MDITATDEWAALVDHHREVSARTLRELFAEDPERAQRLTGTAGDLYVDYSKHRVTDETLRLLVALAEKAGVPTRIEAMFRGEHINTTEDRAVLHVALRAPESVALEVDGQDVTADVHAVLAEDARLRRPGPLAGSGRATPASGSPRWSTSASAAPTSARRWPTRRCRTTATAASPPASCPTSTRPTSPRRPATWTRRRRCSSSAPRPSPRWRR